MTVWVYSKEHPNGVPKTEAQRAQTFHYWNDIPPYLSPLGNGEITSRSHRREELKRNHCVEVEPSSGPHRDGSRYTNEKFIRKHGIPVER